RLSGRAVGSSPAVRGSAGACLLDQYRLEPRHRKRTSLWREARRRLAACGKPWGTRRCRDISRPAGAGVSGIFSIPASAPFGETLARGLMARLEKAPFALADVSIYLP